MYESYEDIYGKSNEEIFDDVRRDAECYYEDEYYCRYDGLGYQEEQYYETENEQ